MTERIVTIEDLKNKIMALGARLSSDEVSLIKVEAKISKGEVLLELNQFDNAELLEFRKERDKLRQMVAERKQLITIKQKAIDELKRQDEEILNDFRLQEIGETENDLKMLRREIAPSIKAVISGLGLIYEKEYFLKIKGNGTPFNQLLRGGKNPTEPLTRILELFTQSEYITGDVRRLRDSIEMLNTLKIKD